MLTFGLTVIAILGLSVLLLRLLWDPSLKETLILAGVQVVVVGSACAIVSCANTTDVETWSGTVVSKEQETVSCSHSYSCNCREVCSGSGNSKSCSTQCDTCYEHMFDYDWVVRTSNQERIEIDRVDRQGVDTPPRWRAVQIGEPTAVEHRYTNYVKGAPNSLFRRTPNEGVAVPPYPSVYDYYRVNRLVTVGTSLPGDWNRPLMEMNARIGKAKQAVFMLVVAEGKPHDWFYDLEAAWLGGKKNDVIAVVGTRGGRVEWVEVMAWTTDEMVKIRLREEIQEHGLDPTRTLREAEAIISAHFQRKPMAEFSYLSAEVTPSVLQWVLTFLAAIVANLIAILLIVRARSGSGFRFIKGFNARRRW